MLKYLLNILAAGAVITTLNGCGDNGSVTAERSGAVVTSGLAAMEPFAASLDADVPVVPVALLFNGQNNYDGRIAVSGVVVQSFDEHGAFIMVDVNEFKSCGLQACTDAALPLRTSPDDYRGVLPEPETHVTVVGDYEPLERGFQFNVHEVHRDGLVVIARIEQ